MLCQLSYDRLVTVSSEFFLKEKSNPPALICDLGNKQDVPLIDFALTRLDHHVKQHGMDWSTPLTPPPTPTPIPHPHPNPHPIVSIDLFEFLETARD